MTREYKRSGGFTLMEMALTIGIITLLMSMMFGLNGSFSGETILRNAANSVSAFVHDTRQAAMMERRPIRLEMEATGFAIISGEKNPDATAEEVPEEEVLRLEDGASIFLWDAKNRRWGPPKDAFWQIGIDGTMKAFPFRIALGRKSMDFEVNPITGEIMEVAFEL
jgi:hypothetical protein